MVVLAVRMIHNSSIFETVGKDKAEPLIKRRLMSRFFPKINYLHFREAAEASQAWPAFLANERA